MKLFKGKGMKALSVSLIAAAALTVTVIVIAFSGASKAANAGESDSTASESTAQKNPADLSADEITTPQTTEKPDETTAETTEEETTEEETTEEETEPVYELAFSSNGDGTCTLTGLGTYKKTEIEIPTLSPSGDIVTAIAGYAFYNETSIVRISLPSTIRSIGEYAFLGCSSMIEISVSSSNTAFGTIDGILYSKDGSRIICCPPMRGKTSCTISKDVAVIESGAFSGVKYLRTVYYTGSAADWTEINVYAHNELLEKIRLTCNYSA